jgi:hypothetical protein
MKQIQFQMKEEVMEALKAEAARMGITPNLLARLIMHERFSQPDAESKTYTFTAENWREIEAYVEEKRLGSVEIFSCFAMAQYMARNALTPAQKKRIDKNINN